MSLLTRVDNWAGPLPGVVISASGVDHGAQLKDKLLLIVGKQDSNVDPA